MGKVKKNRTAAGVETSNVIDMLKWRNQEMSVASQRVQELLDTFL